MARVIIPARLTIVRRDLGGQPTAAPLPQVPRGRDHPAPVQVPPFEGGHLWTELHGRALGWSGVDDTLWLEGFRLRLPCGECRKHWDGMLALTPPCWGDYFAWTVARHNEVNARLGKLQLTVDQARDHWSTMGGVH